MEVSPDEIQDFDIKINRLDYGHVEDKQKHYWRYVYPVKSNVWFLQIESLIYKDDNGRITNFSYLKPVVGNDDTHVFVTTEKDEHYMVIQSGSKIDAEEMFKRVFAIMTSIGLITGYKYGDYQVCQLENAPKVHYLLAWRKDQSLTIPQKKLITYFSDVVGGKFMP